MVYKTSILDGLSTYIETDLICIVLISIIIFKISIEPYKSNHHKNFVSVLISTIAFGCIDLLRVIIDQYNIVDFQLLSHYGYFFILSYSGYTFFKYFYGITADNRVKRRESTGIPFTVLLVLSLVGIVLSSLDIFKLISASIYSFIMIVYTLNILISMRNNKYYGIKIKYLMFPVILLVNLIIHIIFPSVSLIFGMTFVLLLLYMNYLEKLISVDTLTKINNRHSLYPYLEKKMHLISASKNNLYVMMIDANKFKDINDTYGHLEGDRCLIRIANVLKEACSGLPHRAYICRYGGDEFMVIVEAENKDIPISLEKKIHKTLESYNKTADHINELSITIGIAVYDKNKHTHPADLIKAADNCLYKKKKKK